GVVLTKLDGDTRGGAALSIRAVTGKPIKFVGMGEKMDDIEPFYPDRMASRILGMGDVLSFIEKAQNEIDEKEAEKMARKLKENSFDMNDLLSQIKQVKKMGSIGQILSMFPGGNKINPDDIDEKQFVRMEAMINSMTVKEREKPQIINPQRKRRIAAGSGTRVEDVNLLLRQFEQMQKMMKQFTGKGGKRKLASLGSMMGKGKLPF
ncbi:MAG: signal recognition particle protein, partial [Oscillospiraceae bacterium]|nr:signal recognition particle protein [Oscillospiraceae bacterium]